MAGLYIHIPFCASRCIYCGFYSTILSDADKHNSSNPSLEKQYVDALRQEMKIRTEERETILNHDGITSIYLGGGTPSLLSIDSLKEIFNTIGDLYNVDLFTIKKQHETSSKSDIEITMECNPDDITDEFARNLELLPINRVSMGVQTFSNDKLKFLHRRHTANDVEQAISRLRKVHINNISIDLIFGFPNETLHEWEIDIDKALSLNIEHISAYSLMYEEDTPLYTLLQKEKVQEMSDEMYRLMYDTLIDKLTNAGFEHYEISNFARLDRKHSHNTQISPYRSKHNSAYWHNIPYIGIGTAAHSFIDKHRSWNIANIKQYIKALNNHRRPFEEEFIDEVTHYNDIVMTALRTCEGIDLKSLTSEQLDYLLSLSKPLIEKGLLERNSNRLSLTRQGIYISDSIMSDLMMV